LRDQLGDRVTGPQEPRQPELVRGGLTDERDDLLLLAWGTGRLLAGAAATAPLGEQAARPPCR